MSVPRAGTFSWAQARSSNGWLSGGKQSFQNFSLDLGPDSAKDARDDVYPRKVRMLLDRYRILVGQGGIIFDLNNG